MERNRDSYRRNLATREKQSVRIQMQTFDTVRGTPVEALLCSYFLSKIRSSPNSLKCLRKEENQQNPLFRRTGECVD